MTERDWLTTTGPQAMLQHLTHERVHAAGVGTVEVDRDPPLASDRKLRLFACACARQVWHLLTDDAECGRCGGTGQFAYDTDAPKPFFGREGNCLDCHGAGRINRSRRAVEVAERYADGLATAGDLALAAVFLGDTLQPTAIGEFAAWYVSRLIPAPYYSTHAAALEFRPGWPSPAVQADLLRCIFGNPFRRDHEHVPYHHDWQRNTAVLAIAQTIYAEHRFDETPVLADALEEAGCTNADIIDHLRGPGPHARGCHVLDLILGKG